MGVPASLSSPSTFQALLHTSQVRWKFLHTHTHTPPHQISLPKLPREEGWSHIWASIFAGLAQSPARQGPSWGATGELRSQHFTCCLGTGCVLGRGSGKAKGGSPDSPQLCRFLEGVVTLC